jgi:phosphonate transport system ATP-binding protein
VSSAAIELRGLRWAPAGRCLLDVPALRIEVGERVALIGPNGAGKSSLLRLLAGQMAASSGELWVLGRARHLGLSRREAQRLRAEVGQVHQGLHLVPRLSARENALIGALARPLPAWRSWTRNFPSAWNAEAELALADWGLAEQADTRADRLSGGQRQKVALARLRLQRPRLVLADEPTAALDPASSLQACAMLGEVVGSGTLVSVLHQPELISRLADRVIALRAGRIVWDRPAAALDPVDLQALYAPGS